LARTGRYDRLAQIRADLRNERYSQEMIVGRYFSAQLRQLMREPNPQSSGVGNQSGMRTVGLPSVTVVLILMLANLAFVQLASSRSGSTGSKRSLYHLQPVCPIYLAWAVILLIALRRTAKGGGGWPFQQADRRTPRHQPPHGGELPRLDHGANGRLQRRRAGSQGVDPGSRQTPVSVIRREAHLRSSDSLGSVARSVSPLDS
jgi:hypothetical protein